MSNALAKIQSSGTASRAERGVEACLAQGVVKKVQALTAELGDLEIANQRTSSDGEQSSAPRKMGQGSDPRIAEIKAELDALYEQMREASGKITVAATITQGEWRRWADENPVREDGRDAAGRPVPLAYDLSVAAGYCNATALLARIGDFITEWDGEPLAAGQLEWLLGQIHPGDLKQIATTVVGLYEGEGSRALPKPWSGSSEMETSAQS